LEKALKSMDLKELKEATKKWARYCNSGRLLQALGYRTPGEVYYKGVESFISWRNKNVSFYCPNIERHLTF